jgi:uncharacterized membrane protein
LIAVSEHAIVVIDAMALVVVAYGTVQAFIAAVRVIVSGSFETSRRDVWLRYGRWLVAGLTFQLAADIIETDVPRLLPRARSGRGPRGAGDDPRSRPRSAPAAR